MRLVVVKKKGKFLQNLYAVSLVVSLRYKQP